jgi:hypothetical protein
MATLQGRQNDYMAIVADTDVRPERCRVCGALTRTGLLCPEHREEAEKFDAELRGVSTFERIPTSELMVDERFQRDIVEGTVKKIVLNFNEYDLGLLAVSRRDGKRLKEGRNALLDGQQRWTALLRLKYAWAPCEVLTGLSLEQEIMIFCVRNEWRTKVKSTLLFTNKAKAGIEPYASAIRILESFGYRLEDAGPRSTVGEDRLSCPRTVDTVQRMGRLSSTLFTIRRAWPKDAEANRAEVVMGIATFLQLNQNIGADELADSISRFDPEELVSNAKAVGKSSIERRLWVHFYEQIVQAFNYQKKNRVPRMEISPRAPGIWTS